MIKWCMAFTLCSQAYEIWTKTIAVVTCIFYDYLGVSNLLICRINLKIYIFHTRNRKGVPQRLHHPKKTKCKKNKPNVFLKMRLSQEKAQNYAFYIPSIHSNMGLWKKKILFIDIRQIEALHFKAYNC